MIKFRILQILLLSFGLGYHLMDLNNSEVVFLIAVAFSLSIETKDLINNLKNK